jgi:phosphatidylserine/phosphatidylglycerophosphate/cardiolipin synthase-like enzyme
MNRSISALLLVAAGCSGDPAANSSSENITELSYDLMHTRPECTHDGHQDTWCTRDDTLRLADLAGMEARIKTMLDRATDPAKARITIAYFSFSNKAIYNKLCERGRKGIPIEGFFDQSYRTGMPAQLAQECQGPSGNNVRVHFLGQMSESPFIWRLHHNKFLIVDAGDDSPVSLNFSSGNLSAFGTSVHFDHWVLTESGRDSNLVKQHDCVVKALRKAINPNGAAQDEQIDDPDVYRSTLDSCLEDTLYQPGIEWVDRAIEAEKIAPIFSPNPSGDNEQILIDQIDRVKQGGRIYGAMQHFLHYDVARALQQAVDRGVEVKLIMDDDVISGEGEVPGVRQFYDSQLKESVSGIKVQFLVTNAADRQMMHNKFLVLENVDGEKTRVFSGAGHFTDAGLRDNYENFYVTESDELSAKYGKLFDYLWPRTVTQSDIEGG